MIILNIIFKDSLDTHNKYTQIKIPEIFVTVTKDREGSRYIDICFS